MDFEGYEFHSGKYYSKFMYLISLSTNFYFFSYSFTNLYRNSVILEENHMYFFEC